MECMQKVSLSLKVLAFLGFCVVLAAIFAPAPAAFALTLSEILNQPKILGDSASNLYPYPTASLVKDGSTIYFISGTTKVPFTNYKAFIGLGYSLSNVTAGDLSNYNPSQTYVIDTADAVHPWGSWLSYRGVIYYFTSDGMIGVPSSAIFLSNGGRWNLVVKANKYDIADINADKSLAVLTDKDSRVISQSSFQFGGLAASQNNSASSNPAPAVLPLPAGAASTTSIVSIIPQIILPANIYASSTAAYSVISGATSTPLTYTFFWGDGTPSNSLSINSAVHTYYLPGTYILEVTVTDHDNNSNTTTTPVNVISPPNQTPSVPQFALPHGMTIGAQVAVTASASDPQNLPLFYTFSWGDGSADTLAPGNSATHVYSSSDTFVVKVTATNSQGYSNSSQNYLYVAP